MTMMLVDAYRRGRIKECDYIDYQPDYRVHTLLKRETGWREDQITKTDNLKYQFAGIIYGQVILVADGVSSRKIVLNGMTGLKKGPEALQRYMKKCYSSKWLRAKGLCLTEPMFEKLPEEIRVSDYIYWLGSSCVNMLPPHIHCGVSFVHYDSVQGSWLYRLDDDCNSEGSIPYSLRPAVSLPLDIRIDKNNKLCLL